MAAQVAEDRAGTVTPPPVTAAEAATLGVPDLFTRLGNGPDGLGEDEAARRLRVLGPNAVRSYRARAWPVLRGQLRSPLLLLLAVTAVVSWAAGAIAWLRWHWDSDDSRRQLRPTSSPGPNGTPGTGSCSVTGGSSPPAGTQRRAAGS